MSDLRLVPAAVLVWACTWCVLCGFSLVAAVILVLNVAVWLWFGKTGQVWLSTAAGASAAVVAVMRMARAQAYRWSGSAVGTVGGQPREGQHGWLVRVAIDDHPGTIPVFVKDATGLEPGAVVRVAGAAKPSERPGLETFTVRGDIQVLQPPEGLAGWAASVREQFQGVVVAHAPDFAQGLLPGMVLGDTSLQSAAEKQAYIDTGLSHLSAVSGANVTVVTTAVALVLRAVGCGPRAQLAGAAVALGGFVVLVGVEPSVLRAAVMGAVGLLAVVYSTRMQPIHGVCLAVIGLVLWDCQLAVQWGFALSVAATVGIVVLFPLMYRALGAFGWPDILTAAVAVALAADAATAPVVAAMAGHVPLTGVFANVLVAAPVTPVTVLGMCAVILMLLPGGLESVVLWPTYPCTWWIYTVAHSVAELHQPVAATALWVLVVYGWVLYLFGTDRTRIVLGTAGAISVIFLATLGWRQLTSGLHPVQLRPEEVGVVATLDQVPKDAPPGIKVWVVEGGVEKPTKTAGGIPIISPDSKLSQTADGAWYIDVAR
ncbi:multitransmembrane, metal-binding protein [Corynebacterium renale]|uniref:ComEC/Rec2 family competence protein n=1 Tax=Corynebacterium renale TaxID=1724 RepID=UPI000DA28460|nr:ComEC/Rec2 family competence protein [Corynebacterium renale]SQG65175.1 multitransmembrane, metal-binding protein [Corynebacterium renale]STC98198.1 multitransmembrane, metal-binding protein [Corynebacterium renale]